MSELHLNLSNTVAPEREPTLVLAFRAGQPGLAQRRRIPREGILLGRGATAFGDPLDDERMAARHALVRWEGGRALLRDLGSESGTRLNGQHLLGERALASGDVLRLGDLLFMFAMSAPDDAAPESDLVGSSEAMRAVQRSIEVIAGRRHSVVISGETGTGKEVVGQRIHQKSGRSGPFIGVNCGAFTEGLLASDLFGHVRGAFTGAISEQQGLFRSAHGGTLMLDEVAEIPLSLQATLLRVLETREVRPVGSTRHIGTDVRVLATSNRDLIELVQAGRFRADLYSRLAQWTIRLPPLRDRREDIPDLIQHLLPRCDGPGRRLSPDLAELLLLHDWPLNVRGLLAVLSVAVVSSPEDEPLSLTDDVRLMLATTRSTSVDPGARPALALDKAELTELMRSCRGNVAVAARHIGVTRSRLYRLLCAKAIEPIAFREPRPN